MTSIYFSETKLFNLIKKRVNPNIFEDSNNYLDNYDYEKNFPGRNVEELKNKVSFVYYFTLFPIKLIEHIFLTIRGEKELCRRRVTRLINSIIKGDNKDITEGLKLIFQTPLSIILPNLFTKSYKFNGSFNMPLSSIILIKGNLPDKEIIPSQISKHLKSGAISYKDRSQKQINRDYVDLISRISHKIVHEIITFIPTLKKIYFNGYIKMVHPSRGNYYDGCIISFILDVDEYDKIFIENLAPEAILSNFQLHFNYNRDYEISETTPHIYSQKPKGNKLIDLDNINPLTFEELISSLLNKMGLVAETTQASYDGGIDVVAVSDNSITGGRFVIQCKRYQKSIPVDIIRDLYGVMTHERASKGILITTSNFSNECLKFARGKPIELINRRKLTQLLTNHGYQVSQKI